MDSSNAGAIAGGVIVAIITIIVIVIVILVCLRRPKGKEAFTNFRNSIRRGLVTDTLEKTKDMEMDTKTNYNAHSMKPPADHEKDQYDQIGKIGQERASNRPANMDEAQESAHVEQSCMPSAATQMYAVVDKSKHCKPPPQQPVEQMYAVVDKSKRRKPPQQPVQQDYATVDKTELS